MTSLSEQLKRLTTAQTGGLVDSKTRASILFDPKEAASMDRKMIFDLGFQGLSELIAHNHEFAQFQDTLFLSSTLNVDRSTEDSTFNAEIDKNVQKFLFHLSPYFMLRSSHMCLEWLIRRYQIHRYNKECFIGLVLPYHETNMFVKCIQILKFKNDTDPWHWLQPIQKPGVTLPKSAIVNRASSDPYFLGFISQNVVDAVNELGSRASTLQCLFNFHCSVVIGALEICNPVKDWHISAILPAIIKGLKSGVTDFISSSYMVTSQLVNKTQITQKLIHVLVSLICKVNFESLNESSVLLLCWISKTQKEKFICFPHKQLKNFISKTWLLTTIKRLSKDGVSMHYIVIPILKTSIENIKNNKNNPDESKKFIENLLQDTRLSSYSAKIVIGLVLDTFSQENPVNNIENSEVINIDIDNEEEDVTWYSKVLNILELQYPNELEEVINNTMESKKGNVFHPAVQAKLCFRNKFNVENLLVFKNAYHANPEIRSNTVREVVKAIIRTNKDDSIYNILKNILTDCIKDDSPLVVAEVLRLPSKVLDEILGSKIYIENIIEILEKANLDAENWSRIECIAIAHLTSDIATQHFDKNLILFSLMRYLVPISTSQDSNKCLKIILQSRFVEKTPYVRALANFKFMKTFNWNDFKKHLIQAMTNSNFSVIDLIKSIGSSGFNYLKSSGHVLHFGILAIAGLSNDPETNLEIFKFTVKEFVRFKMISSSKPSLEPNTMALGVFTDLVRQLVVCTNFSNLTNWEAPTKSLELLLEIFQLLISNVFCSQLEAVEKLEWCECLKFLLNNLFKTETHKLLFLSQFLIHEQLPSINKFTEMRLRAIRLLEYILNQKNAANTDDRFVLKTFAALSSPSSTVRECALSLIRVLHKKGGASTSRPLIERVVEKSEEILLDAEQLPLILYTLLDSDSKKDKSLLNVFLSAITDPNENLVFKSKVLEMIKHIKSLTVMRTAIPVAIKALQLVNKEGPLDILDSTAASFFKAVISRFEDASIKEILTSDVNGWKLIETSLKMPKVFTKIRKERLIPVPCITLQIFEDETYSRLPTTYQVDFLKLVIETVLLSNDDSLFLDISKALKRCSIDCVHLLPLLEKMSTVQSENNRVPVNESMIHTEKTDWERGVILLELMENKKRLKNAYVLIPSLFEILKKCLCMEDQSPLEYTKQLILSVLLQGFKEATAEKKVAEIPENIIRIDLIVQCIRVTQNPQTHNNALLLLSCCAGLFPQQVLHNLVNIFTFMGSSIARRDDAFNFQFISNVVESIIPILVKEGTSSPAAQKQSLIVTVLKMFSDILLDVPEHRRVPLYSKLLTTLGTEQCFWMFICNVLESQVVSNETSKPKTKKCSHNLAAVAEELPKRIEIIFQLLNEVDASTSIETCMLLLVYVKSLPMSKLEAGSNYKSLNIAQQSLHSELFDIEARSAKQLRHFKYLILQLISNFTSSEHFLRTVTSIDETEKKSIKTLFQKCIINTLSYIPDVISEIDKETDRNQTKFWKVILHHCYDFLDNIISLLSPDMFLVVVLGLLQHRLLTIRKKVIELLISKLREENDYFKNSSEENIVNLLRSLSEIISNISSSTQQDQSNESIYFQQAVLISVKLLSKIFALQHSEQFKNITISLTEVLKKRGRISKVILATAILALVEIISVRKAHSISYLPKFMPYLVDTLRDQATILKTQPPDNVCVALITGVQKLFETMPLFLGPYLVGIITTLSKMWSQLKANQANPENRNTLSVTKLQSILSKMAAEIPPRVLVPNCEKAYNALMQETPSASISFVMNLFMECITVSNNASLKVVQTELCDFFLNALEYRSIVSSSVSDSSSLDEICQVEMEIINAFIAWVLKLSEISFGPLYKKVYDWGTCGQVSKERVLTFFILNKCISKSLKSLFIPFASDTVKDAAELLNACNTSKNNTLFFENNEQLNKKLIENILCTLKSIFLHSKAPTSGYQERFDFLVQPLVDQFDNKLIENCEDLQNILSSCIGQLAVVASSDVLCKNLNHQILLKTRTNLSQVRINAFNCCVELAKQLGDDFTSLLPDTIPFVAELFEDENPEVVKNLKKSVHELESILGESLQSFM